jgi:hypothetical protein
MPRILNRFKAVLEGDAYGVSSLTFMELVLIDPYVKLLYIFFGLM